MAPELRIEMSLEGFENRFEKVPGMGFPDWENVTTPHMSILGPTMDPQRPSAGYRDTELAAIPIEPTECNPAGSM